MKFSINTKLLSSALSQIKTVAKPTRDHAILGNVAFIASDGEIKLIGGDGEKRLELTLACSVKEAGSITLNCKWLSEVLAIQSAAQELDFSTDGMKATIKVGKHTGHRQGLPIVDMPAFPESEPDHTISVPALLLKEAMDKCLPSASTDTTGSKVVFNSVAIISRNGMLNIQAANGKKATVFYTSTPFSAKGVFVIPSASVPMISGLSNDGEVELQISENMLSSGVDGKRFSTKLIEVSTYPDFEKTAPAEDELKLEITAHRDDLITEIKTSMQYMDDMMQQLTMTCDGMFLTLEGSGKELGERKGGSTISAKGSEVKITVSPQSIIDAIKSLPDEEITIRIASPDRPFVIRNETILNTIAPMRVA